MRNLVFIPLCAAFLISCQNYDPCCEYVPVVEQSYVHRYGVEIPPEDWEMRGQHGQVVTKLKNGVVVSRTYVSGILDGETTYTFPHSETIEKKENFEKDILVSDMIFYRSGAPKQETKYEGGKKTVLKWYENGTPQSQETYDREFLVFGEYQKPNSQLESKVVGGHGLKTRRDQYGILEGVDTILKGEVVLTTTYYPNGVPKEMTPFVNGIVSGQVKTFLPGGEPKSIEEWNNGEKTGITTLFENGEKFAEIPYRNGIKNGLEKRYRNNSQIAEEITWIDDIKHGPHSTYIADVVKTDWFFQGKPVTKVAFERMTAMKAR